MANSSTEKVEDKKVETKAKATKAPVKASVKAETVVPQTSEAFIKALRVSPLKLRRVTRVVTGMPVAKAMMHLSFSKMRIAKDVRALLNSAMANAENNHGMDIDNLVIDRIDVGKSFVMKRFRARAKGRGARILKPFSNIRIVLIEKNEG